MGKFRSKLKRHTKGKMWKHGQSSSSNPENQKHRSKARSRFFQSNLSLAPKEETKKGGLTLDAVLKHEMMHPSGMDGTADPTVNDIAQSLKSFNMSTIGGEDDDMSQATSFKTFKTFASNYSSCTNQSFSRLMTHFRPEIPLHKEMLAILTAITEIIDERGGKQTSTEYFVVLIETMKAAITESELVPAIALLAMGIKSVPQPVLRTQFSQVGPLLYDLMGRFINSEHKNIMRSVFGCMSVLLRAQEYSEWSHSSTMKYFDAVLSFATHSKPVIRKASQHAISSILYGSCFMKQLDENGEENKSTNKQVAKHHPADFKLVDFCKKQFTAETIANSQITVLHTLTLLKECIAGLSEDSIRKISEQLLSIMTAANVLIRTNCLHIFHSLFSAKDNNLSSTLINKLILALYSYRPDRSDGRQTIAWLTVLKQAHIALVEHDLGKCINSLPKLFEICATDLWMSDKVEVVNCASNSMKELLLDCVKKACETAESAKQYRPPIVNIIESIGNALSAPFGHVTSHVLIIFCVVFETTGLYFRPVLGQPIAIIASRYDSQDGHRLQIERTLIAAITYVGPDTVLNAFPLTNSDNTFNVNRSWLLPLLREGIRNATLEYFVNNILKLAVTCYNDWQKYKGTGESSLAHTNELLCCQLWGLFPGFCRQPKDIENFKYVAKTLGMVLQQKPELRAPVLDGFKELLEYEDDEINKQLAPYAKNYLPRLFNIYTAKPKGTYENEVRESILQVIKLYLKITPQTVCHELYDVALDQHKSLPPGDQRTEAMFDIVSNLVVYQTTGKLKNFFDSYLIPVVGKIKTENPMVARNSQKLSRQQRKAFELISRVCESETESCKQFVEEQKKTLQSVLLKSTKVSCNVTHESRLSCIKILIEAEEDLTTNNLLISKTLPQILLSYKGKKDAVATELLTLIGEIYIKENKFNDFIDDIMVGFGGDSDMITSTIMVLTTVLQKFAGQFTISTAEFILLQVNCILVTRNRKEVESALGFLIIFVKVLPLPIVTKYLPETMKSLSAMVPDTKRYCRLGISYILKKLCKKFGAEDLIKLVPGNDEVTHKRLKKIRKEQSREKRQKESAQSKKNDSDDSDDEFEPISNKKHSETFDDILADSDSDESDEPTENTKKRSMYIQEEPESILDLADMNSIGKIMSSKPVKSSDTNENKNKKSVPNRGFKVANDGRLIIAEPKKGQESSDDDEEMEDKKTLVMNQSSDSEDEMEKLKASRKRKAGDSLSMASGRTGKTGGTATTAASSKYKTGGKGIHRSLDSSASVKSGVSKATTSKSFGSEYQARKAKGDIKVKGKLEPYAYIPLSRNSLNRRKRAKNAGQFKNIVTAARKGAAAGSKKRKV